MFGIGDGSLHTELFDYTILAQLLFTFCYLISSFVVAGNDYAGFLCVFLGLIYTGFACMSYYGVRKSPSRSWYGAILGASLLLVIISLQSAIFWGQYSECTRASSPTRAPTQKPSGRRLAQATSTQRLLLGIECEHTSAMKSVCAFSVFMFLAYIVQIGLLLKFKNDFLGSSPLDEGYAYSGVPTIPGEGGPRTGVAHATDL